VRFKKKMSICEYNMTIILNMMNDDDYDDKMKKSPTIDYNNNNNNNNNLYLLIVNLSGLKGGKKINTELVVGSFWW